VGGATSETVGYNESQNAEDYQRKKEKKRGGEREKKEVEKSSRTRDESTSLRVIYLTIEKAKWKGGRKRGKKKGEEEGKGKGKRPSVSLTFTRDEKKRDW